MLGLYGYIKQDLDNKNQLPLEYYNIPKEPITDSCLLYVDALNNTGDGTHSNSIKTWKNLKGSTSGSFIGTVPKWQDDCLVCEGKGGVKFPAIAINTKEATLEAVVSVNELDSESRSYFLDIHAIQIYTSLGDNTLSAIVQKEGSGLDTWQAARLYPADLNSKVYLVATYDANGISLYDPVKRQKGTNSTAIAKNLTYYPAIGYYSTATGGIATGDFGIKFSIYSARIHNRALTPEEIKQNMLYERNRYNF